MGEVYLKSLIGITRITLMDIRPSDLPLIVSLDTLLQEKNVTRAAARLNISQPALSAQLTRLRLMFKDPLLIPAESGRGMVATPKALELAAPLAQALRQLATVVRAPGDFDPSQSDRTFHIEGNDNAIVMLGLRLARAVAASQVRIRIAFRSTEPGLLLQRMESGEIDLVLGAARSMPPSLKTQSLLTEHYQMAQRKRHPRGRAALTFDSYCELKHVLVSAVGGFRGFIDDHLEQIGRSRFVAISVPQYNVVPTLLSHTDLVCTLPQRFLATANRQLDLFDLPFETPDFALSLGWHARTDSDPAHRWLREQLQKA